MLYSRISHAEGRLPPRSSTLETAGIALSGVLAAALVWTVVPGSVFKARALVGIAAQSTSDASSQAIPANQFASPAVRRRLHDRLDPKALESVSDMFVATALSEIPGDAPGTLQIFATSPSADQAAALANVAADAIVAQQDDVLRRTRTERAARDATTLDRLGARALAARQRLASLGADNDDQDQALRAAKKRVSSALARVSAIRAIMASGSPPLSNRADVPADIKAAQSTYLDLTQQVARARESLGDRHVTIVALATQVKRAAARVLAEWQRLSQAADHEVTNAQARLDALTTAIGPIDPDQAAAIAASRRELASAESDLARAQNDRDDARLDATAYRVVTPASPPLTASGVPFVIRLLLAGIAALLAFGGTLRLSRHLGRPARAVETPREATAQDAIDASVQGSRGSGSAALPKNTDLAPETSELAGDTATATQDAPTSAATSEEPAAESDGILTGWSAVTTIMVASNELRARTTPVALAIGRTAASEGVRVLIVETARPVPTLASATDAIDPIIIDLFGTLRIALPADEAGLYLVPSLDGGERIAAELTRLGETPVIENIADRFDLVVIDGGCAADVAEAWRADVYLRVGTSQSKMADALFAATFDVASSTLLDTVIVEDQVSALSEELPDASEDRVVEAVPSVIVPLSFHVRPRHIASRRTSAIRQVFQGRR